MNKTVYPQRWTWYNSERRDSVGANIGGSATYVDCRVNTGEPTQVQHFLLDGTGTDESNPKTTTLFTYANGVHLDYTWYAVEESGLTGGFRIVGYVNMVNIDGVVIDYEAVTPMFTSYQDSPSLDRLKIHYVSSLIEYPDDDHHTLPDTGNHGGGLSMGGAIFTKKYWENPNQPYIGTGMTVGQLLGNWNTARLFTAFNWEDADEKYENIINGGDDTPITPLKPSDDTSGPGGGDDGNPDYNPFSDPIDFPDLPTGGDALSSGFIRAYSPSSAQLRLLAQKLWSNDFIDTIKKIQNDPMEAIISLHSIPFSVASVNANCVVGNYDSGISMPTVGGQFIRRNLGSIYIPERWASALDYSPYVTVDIFLPYIGVRSLQVDDIVGRTITVEYCIDVLTGATTCHIKCGDSVLYTYNANIALNIPLSASSMGPLLQSIMGSTANIINGAVAGGIGGAVGGALGSAINVATSKHSQISRGSSLGGNFGALSIFEPYLIIHRPIQSLASGFAHFKGYPSNITGTIGSVSGYTEVESVHLTGITCTDIERDEISALLYNGVIV